MNDTTHRILIERIQALSRPLRPRPTALSLRPCPGGVPRAVLFDVYGTLFVSGSGDIGTTTGASGAGAFAEALAASGLDVVVPPEDGPARLEAVIRAHHARARARGVAYPEVEIREVWSQVLRELGHEDPPSPARIERLAVEYECRVNPVWPMPGLEETLVALREHGLALGIVSNAQFFTPLLFEAFLQRTPADLGLVPELCAWSYRRRIAKPAPELFRPPLAALHERLGVSTAQTLYVGNDLRNDIWPATTLGCGTVLYAGDRRSLRLREDDPCCSGVEPNCIVTDLRQVMSLLEP